MGIFTQDMDLTALYSNFVSGSDFEREWVKPVLDTYRLQSFSIEHKTLCYRESSQMNIRGAMNLDKYFPIIDSIANKGSINLWGSDHKFDYENITSLYASIVRFFNINTISNMKFYTDNVYICGATKFTCVNFENVREMCINSLDFPRFESCVFHESSNISCDLEYSKLSQSTNPASGPWLDICKYAQQALTGGTLVKLNYTHNRYLLPMAHALNLHKLFNTEKLGRILTFNIKLDHIPPIVVMFTPTNNSVSNQFITEDGYDIIFKFL